MSNQRHNHISALAATAVINASIETVWQMLTNVEDYLNWEPNVIKVEGEAALDNQITKHTEFSERALPVRVTELIPHEKMVWGSRMAFRLFKGVRVHPGSTKR